LICVVGADDVEYVALPKQNENGGRVGFGVKFPENLQTGGFRHAYVQEDAGWQFAPRDAQKGTTVSELPYSISRTVEHRGQCFTHVGVVIDDKDFADRGFYPI
jgi:hypothetical protein